MDYEKFKAEVQQNFPAVWEFTDESDLSFNRAGAGGCGGGYHKKYKATSNATCPIAIVWDGNSDLPVLATITDGLRDGPVQLRRPTIARAAKAIAYFQLAQPRTE